MFIRTNASHREFPCTEECGDCQPGGSALK